MSQLTKKTGGAEGGQVNQPAGQPGQRSEWARGQLIEKIVNFVRHDNDTTVLELKMPGTDEEALSQGWPSAASQKQDIQEIVQNLPVDVAGRVKVVKKKWTGF